MKRILKKTAEPNAMRYPGWEPGTGGGGGIEEKPVKCKEVEALS